MASFLAFLQQLGHSNALGPCSNLSDVSPHLTEVYELHQRPDH